MKGKEAHATGALVPHVEVPIATQYEEVPGEHRALSALLTIIRTVGELPKAGALYFNTGTADGGVEGTRLVQWSKDGLTDEWLADLQQIGRRQIARNESTSFIDTRHPEEVYADDLASKQSFLDALAAADGAARNRALDMLAGPRSLEDVADSLNSGCACGGNCGCG